MELEFKADVTLEDGKHEGTITEVQYRETPYRYTDVYVKEKKTGTTIKVGFPTVASQKSGLGKLLLKFNPTIQPGMKVNPEYQLVAKECYFQTITETTEDGEYSRIVKDSIKSKLQKEELEGDV